MGKVETAEFSEQNINIFEDLDLSWNPLRVELTSWTVG